MNHRLPLSRLVAPLWGLCIAAATLAQGPSEPGGFQFVERSAASLELREGERPVLVYNHGPIDRAGVPGARPRSAYVHPLYGLDGETLTDDFPRDHLYHRGVYWAWPHVSIGGREYDQWSLRGLPSVFQRFTAREAAPGRATLGVENAWIDEGRPLVREEVRIDVHPATASTRAIDFELAWTPLAGPLTLWGAEGKSYGGFNFRFARPVRPRIVTPGGELRPSGERAAAGRLADDLVVTRLPWVDYTAPLAAKASEKDETTWSGAAVFVAPEHPDHPPTWMVRHYGLVSVGWPGVEPQTFPAGRKIVCRYRLLVHRGQLDEAELAAAYADYAGVGR